MATNLNPYVNLNGSAREALEFYHAALGGELTITTFGDAGMSEHPESVMHGQVVSRDGLVLMVADAMAGGSAHSADIMTVCLNGDDVESLHALWDALSDGGDISTPLERQVWGDEYGAFVDRFGVPWMVNIATGA